MEGFTGSFRLSPGVSHHVPFTTTRTFPLTFETPALLETPRPLLRFARILFIGPLALQPALADAENPRDQLFDRDWRFLRADAPGAEIPAFDDSKWRTLDVPHDCSHQCARLSKAAVLRSFAPRTMLAISRCEPKRRNRGRQP